MKYLFFTIMLSFLAACGGSDEFEVGQKTTYTVDEVFDAGTVLKGELIRAQFKVTNTGSYPLVIAEVKGSCTCTVVEKPDEPISPGESFVVEAEVDTDKTSIGPISKGVTIVANTEPATKSVQIKALVKEK